MIGNNESRLKKVAGFDIPCVEGWIKENIGYLVPPFEWFPLDGGHSNLTYRLKDIHGRQVVIRRPPVGELLPGAHDMRREWKLISSLSRAGFKVPRALGYCDNTNISDASFYIMSLIEGYTLHNSKQVIERVSEGKRVVLAHSLIDTLANLHAIIPDEVELGDLGKKDNYLGRQLKTWYRSWVSSAQSAQYDDTRAHELQQYFLNHMPKQNFVRVVHGDYGLHNCLIGSDARILGVIDWEIATLGDPLADLGYILKSWPETKEDISANPDGVFSAGGFPCRSEMAKRYSDHTGFNISEIDIYIGFNWWKSAAILHGVYARYLEGKKNSKGVDLENLRRRIGSALDAAEQTINEYKRKCT